MMGCKHKCSEVHVLNISESYALAVQDDKNYSQFDTVEGSETGTVGQQLSLMSPPRDHQYHLRE